MRSRRIYGSAECCVYHCMSRTVNGEMLLGVKEQELLRKMLHQLADFSGVELLTHAIMGNHFHVLVRVRASAKDVSDLELIRRYRVLYPVPTKHRTEDVVVLEQILKEGGEDTEKIRSQLKARMGDVSEFMRSVKQRFSIYYNRSHERYGPFWSDRFKSVVVENDPVVVRTVAAYIDLNPVRAGLVSDPKDYRFCGYAEAIAGNKRLQSGVAAIVAVDDVRRALADYRMVIFGKGARPKNDGSGERLTEDASRSVMAADGVLPERQFLLQRIRYFSEGAVIGSRLFVDSCIRAWSPRIGDRRARKPCQIPIAGESLSSFRRSRAQSANRQSSTVA